MRYVHYLISLPINENDKAIRLINAIKDIEGAEIESTTN